MKVAVINLGCKVNQYEADAIASKLKDNGHTITENIEYADCYIINTCAVTNEAERKSRQMITRVRKFNEDAPVYICGCASEKNKEQFNKLGVVYISGTANKIDIVKTIEEHVNSVKISQCKTSDIYEDFGFSTSLRTRAFIKIQDGCNNFCSYCIIPYLRGRSRSRDVNSIINECSVMSKKSKEIVLTGIDLSSYGKDKGLTLSDLIKSLKDIKCNIRLGSLEANVIDTALLDSLKGLYHFCPHFHLSLQSGDNGILKLMNRHYTQSEFYDKVVLIRQYFPCAAITTDVIIGFPTETDEQFDNTCNFIKKVNFADVHVFPYSKREGTRAYKLKTVGSDIMDKRVLIMSEIKADLKRNYDSKFIGNSVLVLTEEYDSGYTIGYTDNYIRVYIEGKLTLNEFIKVRPSEIFKDGLKAKKEII